jgi:hypothetical protein
MTPVDANLIELIMAAISIGFMGPAAVYASLFLFRLDLRPTGDKGFKKFFSG